MYFLRRYGNRIMEISHILIVVTKIYDYPDDIDHIDDDNDNPQYAHD
jgi:hypothetical protein